MLVCNEANKCSNIKCDHWKPHKRIVVEGENCCDPEGGIYCIHKDTIITCIPYKQHNRNGSNS